MGLLDAILQQAGSAALGGGRGASGAGGIVDLVMKNPQIIAAALSMLNPKDTAVGGGGGLADVIGAFNKGGLGDVMSSWVSGGPNKPVDPGMMDLIVGLTACSAEMSNNYRLKPSDYEVGRAK